MEEVYQPDGGQPSRNQEKRYRGVSYTRPIDAAKELVPVEVYADRLVADNGGGWSRKGDEWVARCPLPNHEDRIPSFTVNPTKGVWFCHGCLRGGSVVDLYMHATGEHEPRTAAAMLLLEFGHEIPQRPASWFRKGERQHMARRALYETRVESHQRRLFRAFTPILEDIQSDTEREEEAEYLWKACHNIGRLLVEGQMK